MFLKLMFLAVFKIMASNQTKEIFTEKETRWIKKNSTLTFSEMCRKFSIEFPDSKASKNQISNLRRRMMWATSRDAIYAIKSKSPLPKQDAEKYQQFPPMQWNAGVYKIGRFGFLYRLDNDTGCFVKSNASRSAYLRFLDAQSSKIKKD